MEPANIEEAFKMATRNLGDSMLSIIAAWRLDGLSDAEMLHYLSAIAQVRAAIAKRLEPL